MSRLWLRVGLVALAAGAFANGSFGQQDKLDLPGMGGFAVSTDGSTLIVSLTAKAELAYVDTGAAKEKKRVKVEFQPTQLAWGDKVLFAAQKGSGVVHVLDADTGKELAKGNADSPVRNLVVVKGYCFASTSNRAVYAFDAKGTTTKTDAQGTFLAADPKGAFLCTVIDGRATTDVTKYTIDGKKLARGETFRSLRASLINVQGVQITGDGKAFGVVAGGGWADAERKRHYSVPLYSTEDMKSQVGELETGAYPSGFAVDADQPLLFACTAQNGSLFDAKSYVKGEKLSAPLGKSGAANPAVLAFVAKGRKLAWGTSGPDAGVLKFYDVKPSSN
jgi:hypothetical protein